VEPLGCGGRASPWASTGSISGGREFAAGRQYYQQIEDKSGNSATITPGPEEQSQAGVDR
jgi:hypothetical protein